MDAENEWIDYPFEEVGGSSADENRIRGNWSSKIDYYLSIFGLNLAFGNFWQISFHCSTKGGAVFLLMYLIMFIVLALPIYIIETSLGQFSNLGAIWKLSPLFSGIGISMVILSGIFSITFSMIVAWALYYMNNSLRSTLPWTTCGNEWNSGNCTTLNKANAEACVLLNGMLLVNGSCVEYNLEAMEAQNGSTIEEGLVLSSVEYFKHQVNWQLAICLFVACLFIFVSAFKGIKTSGKVTYITTVVPYVILVVLLVRLLTHPGSLNGLLHNFAPNWSVLSDPMIWGEATVQVFRSMIGCFGSLIVLASYNRFHNNVFRDMWIISFFSILTTIIVPSVVFSAIGYLCFHLNITPDRFCLQEGTQAMVILFSSALSKLPVPHLFSFMFFCLVALTAFNAVLFLIETIVSYLCDTFPEKLRKKQRKIFAIVLILLFVISVPLCSSLGLYWLSVVELFPATSPLIIIAFFETMVVSWIYGIDNFLDNLKWMVGTYPPVYIFWKILWKFLIPFLLTGVLSYTWIWNYPGSSRYQNLGEFPTSTIVFGWIISLLPVIVIFLTMVYKFFRSRGTFSRRWRDLLNPEDDWGPALAVHRAEQYPMQIPEARKLMPYSSEIYYSRNGIDGVEIEQFMDRHNKPLNPEAFQQNGHNFEQFVAKSNTSEKETII